MTTTKFKLNWLNKRKTILRNKVHNAFMQTKKELVDFLNSYEGEIDVLIKYLASCVDTDDVMTFIRLLEDAINIAKKCKSDPNAPKAIALCKSIIFRIHILSSFTLYWTNVTVKCHKCGYNAKVNFLYTDKLCPVCGAIIL